MNFFIFRSASLNSLRRTLFFVNDFVRQLCTFYDAGHVLLSGPVSVLFMQLLRHRDCVSHEGPDDRLTVGHVKLERRTGGDLHQFRAEIILLLRDQEIDTEYFEAAIPCIEPVFDLEEHEAHGFEHSVSDALFEVQISCLSLFDELRLQLV